MGAEAFGLDTASDDEMAGGADDEEFYAGSEYPEEDVYMGYPGMQQWDRESEFDEAAEAAVAGADGYDDSDNDDDDWESAEDFLVDWDEDWCFLDELDPSYSWNFDGTANQQIRVISTDGTTAQVKFLLQA